MEFMDSTIIKVKGIVQSVLVMMERIEAKGKSFKSRDASSFSHQAMYDLGNCAPVLLKDEEALDVVFSLTPYIQKYKGKGGKPLTDFYVKLFSRVVIEPQMSMQKYPTDLIAKKIKQMAGFLLLQIKGKRAEKKGSSFAKRGVWGGLN